MPEFLQLIQSLFSLVIPLVLLSLGLFVGRTVEKRHLKNLDKREAAASDMFISQIKTFPGVANSCQGAELLITETVIATDYLKNFLARIRNFFGGQVQSYQTLMIRARRESLMRLIEQAKTKGYNAICNVRFETADLGGNTRKKGMVMCGIIASCTAYHAESSSTIA